MQVKSRLKDTTATVTGLHHKKESISKAHKFPQIIMSKSRLLLKLTVVHHNPDMKTCPSAIYGYVGGDSRPVTGVVVHADLMGSHPQV